MGTGDFLKPAPQARGQQSQGENQALTFCAGLWAVGGLNPKGGFVFDTENIGIGGRAFLRGDCDLFSDPGFAGRTI